MIYEVPESPLPFFPCPVIALDPGTTGSCSITMPGDDTIYNISVPNTKNDKSKLLAYSQYADDILEILGDTIEWAPQEATVRWAREKTLRFANGFYCILEHPAPMPSRDTPTGAFSFGRNCGRVEALACLLGCGITLIRPHDWQKDLGVKKDRTKPDREHKELLSNLSDSLYGYSVPMKNADSMLLLYWWYQDVYPRIISQ